MVWSRAILVAVACSFAIACDASSEATEDAPPTSKAPQPPQPPPREAKPEPEPEPAAPRPKTSASLEEATAIAAEIWADSRRTFICGCPFYEDGRVNHAGCGYATRADDDAARHLVWAHVVPPRTFGTARACWSKVGCKDAAGEAVSGVDCCAATDPDFVGMYTDLHNLVPMIQEVANDRAGLPFGEIEGEPAMYGRCDFEVDAEVGLAEPPQERRGEIARAYLYMDATYPGTIEVSPLERRRLEAWSADDPPTDDERARAQAISARQGIPHPWLTADAVAAGKGEPTDDGEVPAKAPAEDDAKAPAKDDAKAPAKDGAKAPAKDDAKAPAKDGAKDEAKSPAKDDAKDEAKDEPDPA